MAVGYLTDPFSEAPQTLGAVDARRDAAVRRLGWCYATLVVAAWAAALVVGFRTSLAVIVALGFFAAIAGLHWRSLGLIGVTTLCTLDNVTRVYLMTGGLLRWNTFNYWLLVVIAVGCPLVFRLRNAQTLSHRLFIAMLLTWLLFSDDWLRGASHILNAVAMLGLLFYFARSADDDETWYWVAIVNALVAALGCCVYFMQRSELVHMDRNSVSQFPLAGLYAACLGFRVARRIRGGQALLVALSAVNFSWAFLSTSRGGTLVASCCLLYMLAEMRGIGRRLLLMAAALVVTLSVMSYYPALQEHTVGRIEKLFDSSYSMTSRTSGRADLALAGWHIFREDPLGVGTGGFAHAWVRYSVAERGVGMAKGIGVEYSCHNVWMKILAENGIPGVLAFAAFVFSFACVGWRSRRPELLRLGLLVTACLVVAFQVTEFQAKANWLLASGAVILLNRRVSDGDSGAPEFWRAFPRTNAGHCGTAARAQAV